MPFTPYNPNQSNFKEVTASDLLIEKYKKEQEQKTPKRTLGEKVLDFTGGKEIAQGLGQAIAQPKTTKQIQETQASQMRIQGDLIERIKQNKAQGLDTSRLENALAMINEDIGATEQGAEQLLNPNQLTTKQVLGDALQLGTTIVGAGTLPGAGKKVLAAETFKQGAIQGAKTGALTGAGFGGATGVSQGLQENKDLTGIAKEGLTGAITGGVAGGVIGGLTGGISGAIKGRKATKLLKQEKQALKAITPETKDLTPTEYEDLLNRGKITPKTKTQPSKYILSPEEETVAKKYKDIFTNDPVKNTENIINEISKKDKEVGTFLKKNNGIFNTGELKNSLTKKLEDIDDLTIDEARLNKLKQNTVNNFLKSLKKNDMETLWKSRKEFDRSIEKAFSGSPTLQNTIKKEFRNAVQDFIAERTPDNFYKSSMKEMSQLFNLKDITNQKAIKEKGMNAIQLWIKKHPTRVKIIGGVAGTGLATGVLSSVLK